MKNQLKIENISKKFKSRAVVKDISLYIDQGEVVGLLGPNGAGKTTSFYMTVGLIPCDNGHIFLNETEITQLPIHLRAKLGISYLPQEPSAYREGGSR